MKTLILAAAASFIGLSGAAYANNSPTHHLCAGLYAHKEDDGKWHLSDGRTVSGKKSVAMLLKANCEGKTHPAIHLKRKTCHCYPRTGQGYYSFEPIAHKW